MRFTIQRRFRLIPVLVVACLSVTLVGSAQSQNYWFEKYERATALIDKGRSDEATVLLREVIDQRPNPEMDFRVPGCRYIDYLPYLQRARLQLLQGKYEAASHSLDVSETFGAVLMKRYWRNHLTQVRQQIEDQAGVDQTVSAASLRLP